MRSLKTVQAVYRVAVKVLKVLFIIALVAGSLAVALCGGIIVMGSILRHASAETVEAWQKAISPAVFSSTVSMTISLAASSVCYALLHRYCKHELADGTPFTYHGASELRKIGFVCIAAALGANVLSAVTVSLISPLLFSPVISTSLFSDYMSYVAAGFDASIGIGIVPGIIMIIASLIFRYGADLEEKIKLLSHDFYK